MEARVNENFGVLCHKVTHTKMVEIKQKKVRKMTIKTGDSKLNLL